MSLAFAALVPNSPEFVAYFSKEGRGTDAVPPTVRALRELEGELYVMRPDTLLVISAHDGGAPHPGINIASPLRCGDVTVKGDVELASHINEILHHDYTEIALDLVAEPEVEEPVITPILSVIDHLPDVRTVVLTTGEATVDECIQLGHAIRSVIDANGKRVAVLATAQLGAAIGDTTHAFDQVMIDLLKERKFEQALDVNSEIVESSGTDIILPLAVLAGVLRNTTVQPELLSYEPRYNAGQLVMNFILS